MTTTLPASLDLPHIQAIVQAMYAVAQADGVHATEQVMLRGFYDECQRETQALTSFDDLIATPFDAAAASATFSSDESRAALLHSCLLLAHADGRYSVAEAATIAGFAAALGVSPGQLAGLEESVADSLLQQISRISNTDALREVSAELSER